MRYTLLIMTLLFSYATFAALRTETIEYRAGNTRLKGYLAWDDTKGAQQPGVLVVHEWWGLNDYARKRAEMLAGLGYTAMALDLYGDGRHTEHAKDAAAFMNSLAASPSAIRQRFEAAKQLLSHRPQVNPGKIAAIGYCFGGATVLNMARLGLDLAAVVSFHGNLTTQTPARPGQIKAKILVLNGADDSFVTADSILAFKQEMTAAGADYQFINYPGALHGFTNPDADRMAKRNGLPLAYNAEADKQSWLAMQALFAQVLHP